MFVRFCPIASGSNGNCIFVSYGETKILIDAGLSGKAIEHGLKSVGVDGSEIDAIYITHEHSDHIKGAGIISRRYNIPIFATEGTWSFIEKYKSIGEVVPKNKRYIYKEEQHILNDISILPFAIPHDAAEPVGYCISGGCFKVAVATDMGHICETVLNNIQNVDILLLESNHDINMLKTGGYPYVLKKRILSDNGHLSNVSAGELLSRSYSEKLKHVILGHLSGENNSPILAYETVFNILLSNGIPVNESFKLHLANRGRVGQLLELHEQKAYDIAPIL